MSIISTKSLLLDGWWQNRDRSGWISLHDNDEISRKVKQINSMTSVRVSAANQMIGEHCWRPMSNTIIVLTVTSNVQHLDWQTGDLWVMSAIVYDYYKRVIHVSWTFPEHKVLPSPMSKTSLLSPSLTRSSGKNMSKSNSKIRVGTVVKRKIRPFVIFK